jgi:hypothetical protein
MKLRMIAKAPLEELFAHAYIGHMGNATAAAREVFDIKSDAYAAKKGSQMVRKSKVQAIIGAHLESQQNQYKKFLEQSDFFLLIAAQRLIHIIQDESTPFPDIMKAIETLTRMAGVELSEAVTIARIKADATKCEE